MRTQSKFSRVDEYLGYFAPAEIACHRSVWLFENVGKFTARATAACLGIDPCRAEFLVGRRPATVTLDGLDHRVEAFERPVAGFTLRGESAFVVVGRPPPVVFR